MPASLPPHAAEKDAWHAGRTVSVIVPATSANLGPGFDCFGLALGLYNRIQLSAAEQGLSVQIEGEGRDILPTDRTHLSLQAAWRVFERLRWSPPGLVLVAENQIPLGSGLGSSAAAVVAGLVAANILAAGQLDRATLLNLAHELEGHADNAAAALLGGLVAVIEGPAGMEAHRLPVADLKVALVVPQIDLPTRTMRSVLPDQVALRDAVFNLGRTPLVAQALREGDLDLLARVLDDRLHQPYRMPYLPGYEAVVAAARDSGAAGVALSGAGPSLLAFAEETRLDELAQTMQHAFSSAGVTARSFVLGVDRQGARQEQN